eukprot:5273945-Amphidinium_carterae.1
MRNVRCKTVGEDIEELVSTLATAGEDNHSDACEDWMMKCCRGFTAEQSASLDLLYNSDLFT